MRAHEMGAAAYGLAAAILVATPHKGVESSEVELDSPEAKQILDILDDLDSVMGREEVIEDLDSVIRSFEEELHPNNTSSSSEVIQLLSDAAGESQPDLGYLLEASDDDLGLPPTIPNFQEEQANTEPVDLPVAVHPDSVKLGNMIGLEHELATYDSFELGLGDGNNCNYFDTVDGLFDYSEPTDFSWRTESLPAL
ncbi:hypothetical protein Adt_45535 [Abeliophyllum distichum]|uniref:Uncharacterized protein n=1 Tax=Abeliophyllum distichum TaxID=126358 RepID=A0ABD1PE07_9LAMI